MQSSHESDVDWQKHNVQNHQTAPANLEQSAAINTKKTANSKNNEDALVVCDSAVDNSSNPIGNNPTVSNPAIGDMTIGNQAIDESSVVVESDLNKSSSDGSDIVDFSTHDCGIEGCDIDASSTEMSDSDESNIMDFKGSRVKMSYNQSNDEESDKYEESDIDEESDTDEESNTDEESDTYEPIKESHFDFLCDLEVNVPNICDFDVHEYNEEETVSNVLYVRKLNNLVNYIDQCNSDNHFILKMHVKAIQDLTPLAEPSAHELGLLTKKLILHVRVLQMQKPYSVDEWSGFLVDVIYSKLDQVTKNLWNKFVCHYNKLHSRGVCMNVILDFLRSTCCQYKKKPPRSISCVCYIYNALPSEFHDRNFLK